MSTSGGVGLVSQLPIPTQTKVQATSGVVANAAATATLAGVANKTTYLTGFAVTGMGATTGASVDVTITGPTTTLHYVFPVPAGATTGAAPLVVELADPIPASAVNTAIAVSAPAFGLGNTAACVSAHGYQA